jgi:hypothetical protein
LYSSHDDVFLLTYGPYPGYILAEQLNEQFISALFAPRRLIVSDDVREGKNGFEAKLWKYCHF